MGTCKHTDKSGNDLFCDLFLKWKSTVQMELDVKTIAIKKIAGLLEKRVEGIMDANRRNYYGNVRRILQPWARYRSLPENQAQSKGS